MAYLLEVKDLCVGYYNVQVLTDINFYLQQGEIVALIGSNGTGKSTFLKTLIGWLTPWRGEIVFQGKKLNNLLPHEIIRLGIAICPEGRRVFPGLTVLENLKMGAYTRQAQEWRADLEKVFNLFPRLAERKNQLAGSLSGGEQQMLALGRALMAKPKLLLIDELSLGLAPVIVENLINTVKEIREQGVSILLVEQNAQLALEISNRTYVLEGGRIVLSGLSQELLNEESIKKAYLGI
ncbi:amino acid/amide ABC transporter ATP-binding protein 2, HAAT family [Thermanaeromonas toyohensis ToBE]|uniref:Amino acid/amide ABC transporter ATP-binding protein 2, HAAT family n=1 Tax=Thermanaeromonas toyohensis ToBE TaxID=698762 RepID=A0A1W1VFD6_9FIRM|nr:ABC transporter ATP-binding protein [Thermanaeromonas toyohensis]SMB91930.1 amino acid/amide ABC transporter ATP-binding protein 2, HAAT family [Thermanaeromonas toyohensis ToBE]